MYRGGRGGLGSGGHERPGGRGRGNYYKEKYGGGRGGKGRQDHSDLHSNGDTVGSSDSFDSGVPAWAPPQLRGTSQDLQIALNRIDGKQYPAYKDLLGTWTFSQGGFELTIDRVQGDPYAPPSNIRVRVSERTANFPPDLYSNRLRSVALRDYLLRKLAAFIRGRDLDRALNATGGSGWHSAKGGDFGVDKPGQQVIERSAVVLISGSVEARLTLAFPGQGRTILGRKCAEMLLQALPELVSSCLCYKAMDASELSAFVDSVEDQKALRQLVVNQGCVAFIPDGAILPRLSGASDLPMPNAVPFSSPPTLRRSFALPRSGRSIAGMAIPRGITLIAGGAYHGKSTLLSALELGCYEHIPGDGREFLVSDTTLVSVQSEDGRCVTGVDISPFVRSLPGGKKTTMFSTDDASGATSMAATIQESMELGSRLLLIDEDRAATNFLIRDSRMIQLVGEQNEPLVPLLLRARQLADRGVSCILVVGGSGDYLGIADTAVVMRDYRCLDETAKAKEIAGNACSVLPPGPFSQPARRFPTIPSGPPDGDPLKSSKTRVQAARLFEFSGQEVDLDAVNQLVCPSQARTIAESLRVMRSGLRKSVDQLVKELDAEVEANGLDVLSAGFPRGDLARCRLMDLAATVNRLRGLEVSL